MMKTVIKKHAVMMEYAIIAVLIAAAVVVAVIMFGKNVSHEMNVATKSMSDAKGAENYQSELKRNSASDIKKPMPMKSLCTTMKSEHNVFY